MLDFKILIIDDNESFLSSAKTVLKSFHVITSNSVMKARSVLSNDIDVVLLDLVFDESHPDELQGIQLLGFIKEHYPNLQTIIMTNYTSTDITVRAIKAGATDFLSKKELDWIEWKTRIENYCRNSKKIRQLEQKNKELIAKYDPAEIIGVSKEIDFVRKRLKDLAQNSSDISILITGETGTGKNLAAKYFYNYSTRRSNRLIEFSIFELSESLLESELFGHVKGAFTGATQDKKGLFEEANKGIILLDEIGDYDLKIQKKIMRFLEEKVITRVGSSQRTLIDAQLILATNQNILQLIEEGKFREDLYHRINRVNINIPPLRERKEDIIPLTDHFFHYFKEKEKTNLLGITPNVYKVFKNYDWPGNVRELQSVVWDACTRTRLNKARELDISHVKDELITNKGQRVYSSRSLLDIKNKQALLELKEIEKALEKTFGNKTEVARLLKMDLDSLRYTVNKYKKKYPEQFNMFPLINQYYFNI
ncbi:MAG: sigma-54 dependent transcriptional regulator [Ignavibacteriaceae bacterium]|nr:sigma-54 dependent transcriptional regulator [Ignavibacteriaceae bacterium]